MPEDKSGRICQTAASCGKPGSRPQRHYNSFLERLKEALVQEVPTFWAVDDVKVAASVNPGDAVEPRIKQRVEAAKADLFVADTASDGPGPHS